MGRAAAEVEAEVEACAKPGTENKGSGGGGGTTGRATAVGGCAGKLKPDRAGNGGVADACWEPVWVRALGMLPECPYMASSCSSEAWST